MNVLNKLLIAFITVTILFFAVTFSINTTHEEHKVYGNSGVVLKRSDKWQTTRKHHLVAHPFCEICKSIKNLEVHHRKPFHENPELELDPNNLITLCRTDHFVFGHLHNFKSYNPDIDKDVEIWRKKIEQRP